MLLWRVLSRSIEDAASPKKPDGFPADIQLAKDCLMTALPGFKGWKLGDSNEAVDVLGKLLDPDTKKDFV